MRLRSRGLRWYGPAFEPRVPITFGCLLALPLPPLSRHMKPIHEMDRSVPPFPIKALVKESIEAGTVPFELARIGRMRRDLLTVQRIGIAVRDINFETNHLRSRYSDFSNA